MLKAHWNKSSTLTTISIDTIEEHEKATIDACIPIIAAIPVSSSLTSTTVTTTTTTTTSSSEEEIHDDHHDEHHHRYKRHQASTFWNTFGRNFCFSSLSLVHS